jgi:hypothetical protein
VAKRADATLYPDSLRESARCLASRRRSSGEINVDEYRWYRGAIRVRAAGDISCPLAGRIFRARFSI